MLAADYIQQVLETEILPSFQKFVKKNHLKVEQKVLQGELFTLIRRHLPELTKEKATYSISMSNIDLIGVNKDGIIVSLGFSKGHYNRYSIIENTLKVLNEALDKAKFDYSSSTLGHELDSITFSLRYAQF